jgi:DNA-binding LacI/PurR family transcriptional regulator
MKLVTINDVAKEASSSCAAVSLVLNDHWQEERISPSTRDRIVETVRRLNYRPSRAARTLRLEKSNLIALAIRTVNHPTQSALNQRILQRLGAHKFEVLVEIVGDLTSADLEKLLLHRPRGLIMGPIYGLGALAPSVRKVIGDQFPLVGFEGWGDMECDLVTYDLDKTVEMSIRHLRRQGHERIGYVIGDRIPQIERKYSAMIGDGGGGFDGALHVLFGVFENGEQFARDLATGRNSPTAYVFQDPCFATGFLRGAWKRGLRVPDDVAFVLTGFAEFCDYLPIKPTTVIPDLDEMAEGIVRLLMDRLEGNLPEERQRRCLVPRLMIGESCGANHSGNGPGITAPVSPVREINSPHHPAEEFNLP